MGLKVPNSGMNTEESAHRNKFFDHSELLFLVHDTYFTNAAACGCQKCVRHVLRHDVMPTIKHDECFVIPPLHRAISNRRLGMVKYLIEMQANINVQLKGKTPFFLACQAGSRDVTFLANHRFGHLCHQNCMNITRSQMCRATLVRSALENTDPGSSMV